MQFQNNARGSYWIQGERQCQLRPGALLDYPGYDPAQNAHVERAIAAGLIDARDDDERVDGALMAPQKPSEPVVITQVISDALHGHPVVVVADEIDLAPIDVLRREYERLTGEIPDGRWRANRLQKAVDTLTEGE